MNLIYFVIVILLMSLNYPVVDYLHKVNNNKKTCECSKSWMLNYLYYFLLAWYAFNAVEIISLLLLPKYVDWFSNSSFYYPLTIISGVSYSFYIIVLWAYFEYLKNSKCTCSNIKVERYAKTYSWFAFTLYIISVSYIGFALSSLGKTEAKRRGTIQA